MIRREAARTLLTAACILGALLLGTRAASAQDLDLQRVQNLIAGGRFTEAGTVLSQWESAAASRTTPNTDDLALGRYLRGVLTSDAAEAENIYLEVVLSYPTSAVAPQALLRLGQGLFASGENRRALAYLQRLRSDYPGTPERETGMLWLARAQQAAGQGDDACATVRDALGATSNPNVRSLLQLEGDRACGAGNATPRDPAPGLGAPPAADPIPADAAPLPQPVTQPQPQPQSQPVTQPQDEPVRTSSAPPAQSAAPRPAPPLRGEYAVQVGAYREKRSAETIATQMREKGIDARIVQVDDSPLWRIRVGEFASSAEAAVAGQRVRDAGFAVIIVSDVRREM